MANKLVYPLVAVFGIAAASGFAWWYQKQPQGPNEVKAAAGPAAAAPSGPASAARPAGVEVTQVARQTLQDDAQSVGSLRSRQSVMLRPEVPGRVRTLGFTDGAAVRRGQLMVQLDDTLQRAEVKQAKAQVSIAQANFNRNTELVAQNFVARRVLDESAASLQVAEAQLALSCARLARMAILAPFDGTVGIRNVNIGDFVKDGADLINLEDTGSMYVDFRLPERFQTRVRLRQTVEVQLDALPGRRFKATVEAIDPLLDANGRSVGVRAVLPNTPGEAIAPAGRPGGPGGPGAGAAGPAGSATGARPPSAAGRPAAAGPRPDAARAAGGPRTGPGAGAGRPATAASGPGAGTARAAIEYDADGCPVLAGTDVTAALASGARLGGPPAASPTRPGAAPGAPGARPGAGGAGAGRGADGGGNPTPLRPGMFARVTAVFAIKEQALVVPEEAIVPQGGRQFVIKVIAPADLPAGQNRPILAPDTKLVSLRQEVRLGARQLGKVEVLDGLKEGETVVIAGQQRLQRDGSPLRIVEIGRNVPGLGGPREAASAPGAAASGPLGAASR